MVLLVLVYSGHTGWRFDGLVQCNWKKKDGLLKGRLETEYTPDEITHSCSIPRHGGTDWQRLYPGKWGGRQVLLVGILTCRGALEGAQPV